MTKPRKAITERAELTAVDARRLVSCHELLARACFDLGIKAEGSSKLTRALEDVAQARDTLWEITQSYPRHAFNSPAVKTVLRVEYLDQLVFRACNGAAANWAHWRKKERKLQHEGEDAGDDEEAED